MLAEIAFSEHQPAAAVAGAEAVLADANAAGFDDPACDALELIGRHRLFIAVQLLEAEPYFVRALRGRRPPACRSLGCGSCSAWRSTTWLAAPGRMQEGRELSLVLGALASLVEFEQTLATDYLLADDLNAAESCAEHALAEARRYGLAELEALLLGLWPTITAIRGDRE
jgi:hypothetical protein